MIKWLLGPVPVLASVLGLAAVDSVAAQGIPQELQALNAKVAAIQATLDGINLTTNIVTGPLQRASNPGSNFKCMVVNAGTTNANFTIEIRNQQGVVEDSALCTNLAPGAVCGEEAGPTNDQVVYCRVSGIEAKNARVTLCAREAAVCVAFVTAP